MDINPLEIDNVMNTTDGLLLLLLLLCPAAGAGAGEEEDALPTYKDAFPPLPEKMASPEGSQDTTNAWNKIRPLKSSIITQVRRRRRQRSSSSSLLENTHCTLCTRVQGSGCIPLIKVTGVFVHASNSLLTYQSVCVYLHAY